MKLNLTKPLIVFDLETTGLDMIKTTAGQIGFNDLLDEVRRGANFILHIWNTPFGFTNQ